MTTRKRNEIVIATSEATGTALSALPDGDLARLKLPGEGGGIRREGAVTLVEGRGYAAGDAVVVDATVYFDADRRPDVDGVWRGEADKVGWKDTETGFECTIMRDGPTGTLGGYVGVGRHHPLRGYEASALPNDVGILVHGGITYARFCEEGPSPRRPLVHEARSICHVVPPIVDAGAPQPADHFTQPHLWWFGFTCDHPYDLRPREAAARPGSAHAGIGATYRDDAYVLNEVRALARQLQAIAEGGPMPSRVGSPPPIGLDPGRRS